jgi:hypothetical protein
LIVINNNLIRLMQKMGMETGHVAGLRAAQRTLAANHVLGAPVRALPVTERSTVNGINKNLIRLMHKMGVETGRQASQRTLAANHVLGAAMEVLLDQVYGEDDAE